MPGRTECEYQLRCNSSAVLSPLFALQPNAKSLLHDAAARYRNSKSFRLEFETTITSSSPYSHGWSKQMYAVAAADHKYHWEQKGSGMTGLRISDSQSDWFYRPGAHAYSVQSPDSTKSGSQARGTAGGTTEGWIKSAIHSLLQLATMPIPPCCSMTNW
jgi:outer membrane lipoprotein-sorting protein